MWEVSPEECVRGLQTRPISLSVAIQTFNHPELKSLQKLDFVVSRIPVLKVTGRDGRCLAISHEFWTELAGSCFKARDSFGRGADTPDIVELPVHKFIPRGERDPYSRYQPTRADRQPTSNRRLMTGFLATSSPRIFESFDLCTPRRVAPRDTPKLLLLLRQYTRT